MMDFSGVQQYMREQRIGGWLLYDFRGNNQIFAQALPGKRWTTRRAILFVPAVGEAVLLAHGIDWNQFEKLDLAKEKYLSWQDLRAWLAGKLSGAGRVAMEYAPGGALPVVSIVDAGTVEFVRSLGVEVASSANIIQVHIAKWSATALETHRWASKEVTRIKDEAFKLIRERLSAKAAVNEYEVQQFIVKQFAAVGLEATEPPIVAINAHSGDPHFEPSAKDPSVVKPGDWVLIDLWARKPGNENIFSDITWVGFAGKDVPAKHREVFNVVKGARDGVVKRVNDAWRKKETLQGWQLDEVARKVIIDAGYEKYIRHRTGHSLSPGVAVHGVGVNIDNLETHDTREVLAGIGFTVEPGVYLPEFGVRLEINMYMDEASGPVMTSCNQDDVVLV